MSISKHVDIHNTTGIALVSIRDRFCSRESSGEIGRGCSPAQYRWCCDHRGAF